MIIGAIMKKAGRPKLKQVRVKANITLPSDMLLKISSTGEKISLLVEKALVNYFKIGKENEKV
jgi:hypothetical protein